MQAVRQDHAGGGPASDGGLAAAGGLILAAPYAAAMSAVAGFLLLMSSSLVRDIYQRNINPSVSPRAVSRISYATTAVVGAHRHVSPPCGRPSSSST